MEAQARYPGRQCIAWVVISGYSACAGQWRLSYKARKRIGFLHRFGIEPGPGHLVVLPLNSGFSLVHSSWCSCMYSSVTLPVTRY